MSPLSSSQGTIHFGDFDVDPHSGELRKDGIRIKLQVQPFQVLQIFLEHPGEVITREELQKRIWPPDTFVDFDQGLNNAVKKLRDALADDAEKPRFIETLSRRGYRFIAPLTSTNGSSRREDKQEGRRRLLWAVAIAIVVGLVATGLLASNMLRVRDRILGTSAPQIRSFAVLPLANLSGDPAQEYFSDGITDTLITDLAQIGSLSVISRTSSMQYKQPKKSLPEIARELKVDGIVEGTVQRSGDRVRVTVQLIHGPSDRHLWARSYDRDLRDILQLQDEVAHDISEGISANLAGLSRRPVSSHPLNVEAYDDYLQGRNYARRWTKEDLVKGVEFLERSVERDPTYAPAYAELSYANHMLAALQHRSPAEVLPKAKTAAMKALALDENLAEAHSMLAWTYFDYEWNWPAGEREFRRAVELDPNSSFARAWYAVCLTTVGQKAKGIQEIKTALELDPFSPVQHTMASYIFRAARRNAPSLREAIRAVEIDPSFAEGHANLAAALGAKAMFGEAFAEWLQYLSLDGDADLAQELGTAARKISSPVDPGHKLAHITIAYYQRKSKTQYVGALTMVGAYIDVGDKDNAFKWLNKAYEEHSGALFTIAVEPIFDPLRSDPRFQDLLRRINLPAETVSGAKVGN